MYLKIFFLIILQISRIANQEVQRLPGLPKIAFRHYSGYLNASSTHFLHYWFVESQSNPATDPLLLWMNGGPGCSSLDGFLSELGPFLVNDDGATLRMNPFTWNKKANMIFLEAPAGVGFSYSSDGDVTTNDDQTSMENYNALKHFFEIFPRFLTNDFYVTGESYGGIYVPTLAVRIVEGLKEYPLNFKVSLIGFLIFADAAPENNLNGIAIGNGMLDFTLNTNTLIEFAYNHGLVDEKLWHQLGTTCCDGCGETCNFFEPSTVFCNSTVNRILNDVYEMGLNVYDLYRDCYHGDVDVYQRHLFDLKRAFPKHVNILSEVIKRKRTIQKYRKRVGSPPCLNDTAIRTYLNRKDVQEALNVKMNLPPWTVCSENVENHYLNVYKNMYPQFEHLMHAQIRILVYNGDTDMACNFLMNQKFVSNLNLTLVDEKKAWLVNNQIAGYITSYKGLDFVTVKGTGHMVPQWKPEQAYHMIKGFLSRIDF